MIIQLLFSAAIDKTAFASAVVIFTFTAYIYTTKTQNQSEETRGEHKSLGRSSFFLPVSLQVSYLQKVGWKCWLDTKAVPGQLPLFPAKAKTPRRPIPPVTPLGKLIHCRTILLVNNLFLKSKVNLPSSILGLLPPLVPSASTRRN